jgi:hydroxymethylpyrimidine/phosphomethylpyrimidine kinase
MKKILFALIPLAIATHSFAQSEKFVKAMTADIALFDSAKTADDMLAASAAFERIADAEKNQWLPYYYASLSQVIYAFMKNDMPNNDAIAGKAEQLLAKADALQPNNSEISCVKSMIATLHMLVNPQQRWQQYGAIAQQELEKAKSQDPSNPRPYYIQGNDLRNTPEQFGGGCSTAKPLFEQALKKYETFKPASGISPNWGKARTEQLLAGCK